jgi:hypothetical protein
MNPQNPKTPVLDVSMNSFNFENKIPISLTMLNNLIPVKRLNTGHERDMKQS